MSGLSSDASRIQLATCIRIASLAVGGYDYLLTLPAEWRIYKRRSSFRVSGILFFLIRYTSILVLTIGSWTWFYKGFTVKQCRHVYLLTAICRVFQVMASQAVLGWRTCNTAQRRSWIVGLVVVSYFLACTAEWFTNIYSRQMMQTGGSCRAVSTGDNPIVWIFYLCSLVYDFLLIVISSWFLLRIKSNSRLLIRIKKMMLIDGLVYFVLLAAANIINIFVVQVIDEDDIAQAAASPVASLATWIMSQRILINLNETSLKLQRNEAIAETVAKSLSRQPELSAQFIEEVTQEVQSQFHSMSQHGYEDKAGGKDDNVSDMLSPDSSQRYETGNGRFQASMSLVNSDDFLDTIIDIEVDVNIQPTVVAGGRTLGENEPNCGACGEG